MAPYLYEVADNCPQSHQASDVVKQQGGRNDLLERIKRTEFFKVRFRDYKPNAPAIKAHNLAACVE
jgi:hypothetical protein